MKITPSNINRFMFFKLPLGWLSGMRVKNLTKDTCEVMIRFRWLNQNPFNSMFWAAQGMAAEMATGALVMQEIYNFNRDVSMLVTHQEGQFFKKVTGKIIFTCSEGALIKKAIEKSMATNEGQMVALNSIGINETGVMVSKFQFQWSLKVKN